MRWQKQVKGGEPHQRQLPSISAAPIRDTKVKFHVARLSVSRSVTPAGIAAFLLAMSGNGSAPWEGGMLHHLFEDASCIHGVSAARNIDCPSSKWTGHMKGFLQ